MSRRHGAVDSAARLIPFGHLGWGFRDRAEFLARAAEYIADGLAQNQWVEYVGAGSVEQLRAEVAALPVDSADVKVTPVLEFYGLSTGDVVDPDAAVARRVAAVEHAVAQGYSGFRAIVDCTAVSRRPDQRETFARFEFLIDQKMAVLPVSALCAYDVTQLAGEAAGLICLHPLVSRRAPAFQIYAEPGTDFALAGEIDTADADVFSSALQFIWPLVSEPEAVIDISALDFISHRQLIELNMRAQSDGRVIVLRGVQPIVARLIDLLDLDHLREKTAPSAF